MKKLPTLLLCLFAPLVVSSSVTGAERGPTTQFIVSVTLEESSAGKEQVLAQPKLAVTLGRPFAFDIGSRAEADGREGVSGLGTRAHGKLVRSDDGALLVDMKLSVRRPIADPNAPDVDIVRADTIDFRAKVAAGHRKRIKCGESQTLELYLEPAPNEIDEPDNAREPSAAGPLRD